MKATRFGMISWDSCFFSVCKTTRTAKAHKQRSFDCFVHGLEVMLKMQARGVHQVTQASGRRVARRCDAHETAIKESAKKRTIERLEAEYNMSRTFFRYVCSWWSCHRRHAVRIAWPAWWTRGHVLFSVEAPNFSCRSFKVVSCVSHRRVTLRPEAWVAPGTPRGCVSSAWPPIHCNVHWRACPIIHAKHKGSQKEAKRPDEGWLGGAIENGCRRQTTA